MLEYTKTVMNILSSHKGAGHLLKPLKGMTLMAHYNTLSYTLIHFSLLPTNAHSTGYGIR